MASLTANLALPQSDNINWFLQLASPSGKPRGSSQPEKHILQKVPNSRSAQPWSFQPHGAVGLCACLCRVPGNAAVKSTITREILDPVRQNKLNKGGTPQCAHCRSVSSPFVLACSSFRVLHYKSKYLEAQHETHHLSGCT